MNLTLKRFFILFGLFTLASCSSGGANYKAGWVTKEIRGKVTPSAGVFIVVEQQDQTFLPGGSDMPGRSQNLTTSTARVVQPDKEGNYSVTLPSEARSVSLFFVSEGNKPARKSFERSLGVGVIEQDVTLEVADNFKELYFLSLRPYLSGFISEKRYKMPEYNQYIIGQWMENIEKKYSQ